jgi:predicted phosphodiesterase
VIRKPPKPPSNATVLVIGDLHTPFTLDGYLEHCINTYNNYNCDYVVFIGDIIDQHFTSFHPIDPDGYGAGEELDRSIDMLAKWYEIFSTAIVIIGNHDRLVRRKAFDSGISKRWIRDYCDVLGTPGWYFTERYVIDKVQYIHGESGQAIKKAKDDMMSTVQGHLHTKMYTQYDVGSNFRIFGCAVGCGIDHEAYAMNYSKHHPKPAIGCAVVFEGDIALNVPMKL